MATGLAGLGGGAGAAGQLAGGIAGLLGDKPLGPRASIRATAQGTLRGYQDTLPLSLALDQLYNPSFLAQGGMDLQRLLFGGGEQSYSNTVYDGKKNQTVSGTIPGSPGLLDTIEQAQRRLAASNQTGTDSYRQSELDSIARYLPQAQALYAQANPEQARLQQQIGQSASEQLALGDRVNPELARNWQDQNTARYANMGFRPNEGFVQADDFMRYTGGAQALQGQRQGYALDALSRLSSTQPQYASLIRSMMDPSQQQGLGLVTGQQPLTFTGNQYSPYNVNTTSLSNQAQGNSLEDTQNRAAYWANAGSGLVGTGAAAAGAF